MMEKLSDVIKQVIEDWGKGAPHRSRPCEYYRQIHTAPCYICPFDMCRIEQYYGYRCAAFDGSYDHGFNADVIADLKANLKVVLEIEKDNPNVVIT